MYYDIEAVSMVPEKKSMLSYIKRMIGMKTQVQPSASPIIPPIIIVKN